MSNLKNADFIKMMVEINKKYAEEHPDEEPLLRPNVSQYLENILEQGEAHGNDPQITNLLFNKGLKAQKNK